MLFQQYVQNQTKLNLTYHGCLGKLYKKIFFTKFCIKKKKKVICEVLQTILIFDGFQLDCQPLKILTKTDGNVAFLV